MFFGVAKKRNPNLARQQLLTPFRRLVEFQVQLMVEVQRVEQRPMVQQLVVQYQALVVQEMLPMVLDQVSNFEFLISRLPVKIGRAHV